MSMNWLFGYENQLKKKEDWEEERLELLIQIDRLKYRRKTLKEYIVKLEKEIQDTRRYFALVPKKTGEK